MIQLRTERGTPFDNLLLIGSSFLYSCFFVLISCCLFKPSLLKIWNLNKFTGVIGVFNCQGSGNWPCQDRIVQEEISSELSGQASPADIEYFQEVSGKSWTGDCAVFSFSSGRTNNIANPIH